MQTALSIITIFLILFNVWVAFRVCSLLGRINAQGVDEGRQAYYGVLLLLLNNVMISIVGPILAKTLV